MDILLNRLKKNEGYKNKIYLDHKGNVTGGWGHHFWVGSYLPKEVSEILLKMDINNAVAEFRRLREFLGSNVINKLNEARRRVVVEMLFNMKGIQSVLGFKEMWKCIGNDDWTGAKREMLWNDKPSGVKTKWYIDVGARAQFLANIMESGIDPEEGEKS